MNHDVTWVSVLQGNDEYRKSFNDWVEEAIKVYAEKALMATANLDQLLGLRYAAGELRALQGLINYKDEEITRENNYVTQGYLRA